MEIRVSVQYVVIIKSHKKLAYVSDHVVVGSLVVSVYTFEM